MTADQATVGLPESLDEIAQDFAALSVRDRLTLLLDFSDELPELPERYQGHPELLERVDECQSPLFWWSRWKALRMPRLRRGPRCACSSRRLKKLPRLGGSRESCTRAWTG